MALRQRTTIALLRVYDEVIVLQTLMWPDEVRVPDFAVDDAEVSSQEAMMATLLVDTLAGDFDPADFTDDYASAVQTLVETKIEGGEVQRAPETEASAGEVVDLLAALQRSVAAAKEARGESDATDQAAEEKPKKRAKKKAS